MGEIVIFSKQRCPHCIEAKAILGQLDVPVTEINLDDGPHSGMLMAAVTGKHTVPQIFFHETHIGGASDLKALDEAGLRSGVASALDQSGRPWFLDKPPGDDELAEAVVPIKDLLDPHIPADPTLVPEYAPVATWYASMFGFLCNLYDQMILKPEPTALWMSTLSALMVPMAKKIGPHFGTICLSTAMKAGCSYCSAHGADLAMKYAGDKSANIKMLIDHLKYGDPELDDLPFDARLRSLINVAQNMTTNDVTVEDIECVRSAFGVLELRDACVSVAAMGGIMGFLNRFNDLIGVEIEASIKHAIDDSEIGSDWQWGTHDTADEVNRYDRSDDSARENSPADGPVDLNAVVVDVNKRIISQVGYLFDKYGQYPDQQLPAWIAILADDGVARAVSSLYHSLFHDGDLSAELKHLAAYAMLIGSDRPGLAADEERIVRTMSADPDASSARLAAAAEFARSGNQAKLTALDEQTVLALRLAKCADHFPHIVRGELVVKLGQAFTPQQIVELVMALAVVGSGQRWSSVIGAFNRYTFCEGEREAT